MRTGRCECGAVQYEVTGETTGVTYCHCSKCRRWHGHVGAWTAVDRPDFRVTQARGLKWHDVNPKMRRGFCAECGCGLFFDEAGDPKMGITAGSLAAPTGLRSKAHIYVASKGDYYEIPDDGLTRYDAFK